MGKGENAGCHYILFFLQCCQKYFFLQVSKVISVVKGKMKMLLKSWSEISYVNVCLNFEVSLHDIYMRFTLESFFI